MHRKSSIVEGLRNREKWISYAFSTRIPSSRTDAAAAPVCTHPAAAGQVYKFRPENLVLVRRMCFPRVFLH